MIHPIAGQGLNLGLKDAAALAEAIVDAARLGLDPGGAEVLGTYERARRFDTFSMGVVTDGLNRLFSNDALPLRLLRDLGLGVVDRMPALKRFFIREAAGLSGEGPRLMRGEGAVAHPFARSIPSSIRRFASSASPQRTILTHLPGSRSL